MEYVFDIYLNTKEKNELFKWCEKNIKHKVTLDSVFGSPVCVSKSSLRELFLLSFYNKKDAMLFKLAKAYEYYEI